MEHFRAEIDAPSASVKQSIENMPLTLIVGSLFQIFSAIGQLMMKLECGRAPNSLTLCARTVRDLPLTNIAEKHAVVASLSRTPTQL